jgi:predicted methyltransferase
VQTVPYHVSHSCAEPWRMSSLINKIVNCARLDNDDIFKIEKYCLSRYEDVKENIDYIYSDPTESISRQIAKISLANELYGKVGSNTHLSIFAKSEAKTNWIPRGSYLEGDRNQLICDLVKTYNNF